MHGCELGMHGSLEAIELTCQEPDGIASLMYHGGGEDLTGSAWHSSDLPVSRTGCSTACEAAKAEEMLVLDTL